MPDRPLHPRRAKSGSPTEGQPLRPALLRATPPPPAPRAARLSAVHGRAGEQNSRRASRAQGRPDTRPPARAISTRSRTTIRRLAERSAPATPSSAAAHRSRLSRRRLVLDGSSAVRLPGDIADVHVGVQHVGADDHRTGSTLKTTYISQSSGSGSWSMTSVTGTTRGRLAAPAGERGGRDDDEENDAAS